MYDQSQFTPLWMIDKNGLYICRETYFSMEKNAGYAPDTWFLYTQNKPESFWFGAYDEEALEEEGRVGFKNFTDPAFLQKFDQAVIEAYGRSKEISEVYLKSFYTKEAAAIENHKDEVVALIQKMYEMAEFTMSWYLLTQPQVFNRFEAELEPFMPNKDLELVSTNGRYLTYVSQIQNLVVNLATKITETSSTIEDFLQNNPEWQSRIAEVSDTLGFLNWGLFGGELASQSYITREVQKLVSDPIKFKEEKRKMDEVVEHIQKRNTLVQKAEIKGIAIADVMGQAAVWRFDLQTGMLCVVNYAAQLISAVQEKYGLTKDEIDSYFCDDIVALIKTGTMVSQDLIEKRQKGFLTVFKKNDVQYYLAEEAHAKIQDLLAFRLKEIATTTEVRGTIASWPDKSREKIQGRAFVLTTAFDVETALQKFNEGDILVATQTHPNLVPQMKNAIAIVTDEGGITCHAAIVSRELRKPCIIGTRLATKIFKTGDTLELDLKAGTIKKIG